jgi:hypothetical protein
LTLVRPCGLVELGTGSGVFSSWLAERVKWFATLDIRELNPQTPGFHRLNVWEDEDEIVALMAAAPRPFVLFCDDGNKALEVAKYAPALRVGDYLAVHDFGTEVIYSDIPPNYTLVHTGGLTGFFRKAHADPPGERLGRVVRLARRRLRIRTRLFQLVRR